MRIVLRLIHLSSSVPFPRCAVRRIVTKTTAMAALAVFWLPWTSAAAGFDEPWHVRLPRSAMLEAWKRLKTLAIPGVPTDMRFKIPGESHYVSPDGDDANPGTKEKPWKSLQRACDALKPNTVVCLAAGTYYGPATVRTRATREMPAAIRAADGAEVVVTYGNEWVEAEADKLVNVEPSKDIRNRAMGKDGESKHYPPLLTLSGGFIEVSGLHFVGVRDRLPHNLYSENGVSISRGMGYRVLYNEIENVGHCGVKAMSHGEHHYLIEGNYIHDVGHTQHDHGIYCPSDDGIIRRNIILNSAGYGIHAYSTPARIIVSHNIIAGHSASGIILGGPDAGVFHNVVFGNRGNGVFFFRKGCVNAVVENNIFGGTGPAFGVDHTPTGNLVDYNCIAPDAQLTTASPAYTYGNHNIKADPKFVNAAVLNFTIQPNSPCADAGAPGVGAYFGEAPDIGLFETGRAPVKGNAERLPEAMRQSAGAYLNEVVAKHDAVAVAAGAQSRTFHVDAERGSDTHDGLSPESAWRSLGKVNTAPLAPGDRVLFRRGQTWRGQLIPHSGNAGGVVTYGAFGEGPKPVLLGSAAADQPEDWQPAGDGIWATVPSRLDRQNNQAIALSVDVGNVIFDGGKTVGVKKWSEADLRRAGDFYYDPRSHQVKLRSEANPAIRHQSIELALTRHIINQGGRGYVTYENLDLRYGAAHGIGGGNTHHITVRGCDLSYIGGGHQHTPPGGRPVRYGNGIEFWSDARDCLVEDCRLWEIYDAALTNQGSGTNVQENITYRNNVVWNSEYSFEYWNRGPASRTRDIVFEHNTCVDAGHGWGHDQRPDPNGRHLMFYNNSAATTNVVIRNNIFCNATDSLLRLSGRDWTAALVMDRNCWFQPRGLVLLWGRQTIGADEFAAFMHARGLGRHSLLTDPKFVDPAQRDYRLTPDSPARALGAKGESAGALPD